MNSLITAGYVPDAEMYSPITRVLIVEDEVIWQIMLRRALQRIDRNIDVLFSESAGEAVDQLGKSNVDFIIADHGLNGNKTGLDLWDYLLRKKSEIPYVLLSGSKKAEIFDRLTESSRQMVPTFLEKPQSVSELSKELSKVLYSNLTVEKAFELQDAYNGKVKS